jgi:hypothetical protein
MKSGETVNDAPLVAGMAGRFTVTALRLIEFVAKGLAAEVG